jgi:hypothetical protein
LLRIGVPSELTKRARRKRLEARYSDGSQARASRGGLQLTRLLKGATLSTADGETTSALRPRLHQNGVYYCRLFANYQDSPDH